VKSTNPLDLGRTEMVVAVSLAIVGSSVSGMVNVVVPTVPSKVTCSAVSTTSVEIAVGIIA
jgi:flagellar motor switch protein FliM